MSAIDVQNINSKTGSSAITIADSGDISLSASITFDTDTLYVDASNNRVGIGTTSPVDKLHVYSGAAGGSAHSYSQLVVENSTHNAIQLLSPDSSEQALWFGDASSSTAGGVTYYHPDNIMTFRTSGTEAARINSAGRVGIGTTSPSQLLSVKGTVALEATNSTNAWLAYTYTDNSLRLNLNGAGADEIVIDSSGNVGIGGSPTAFGGGYIVSQVTGSPGAYSLQSAGGVVAQNAADSGVGGGLTGTRTNHPHVFVTNNTERMRIDGNGYLIVGNTAVDTAGSITLKDEGSIRSIYASGVGGDSLFGAISGVSNGYQIVADASNNQTYKWHNGGTANMTLTSSGQLVLPGVAADTTSDAANLNIRTADGLVRRSTSSRRYKNSITDATHGLTELLALRSVTYKGNNDGDRIFGGLIAEEVHEAGLTEFVQYDSEGNPDALAYGHMIALCVKAIQELTARVAELEGA